MGKKNTEIRTFLGGVNSDDTPSFIGKDEVLNAINTTISNDYGSDGNYSPQDNLSLRSLNGKQSSAVNAINFGFSFALLGKVADTRTNTIYLFYYNSGIRSRIVRLTKSGTADIFFQDTFTTSGLNWNANLYISARLSGNNLIFTDPINGTRFLDVTKTYTASSVTKDEMSFIRVPFASPLSCSRVSNPAIFNYTIQLGTFQMCVRMKDVWGFETVLSPLSETQYPERQSNIDALPSAGNTIKADLNFSMKIPAYWDNIDFIVRNVADNTFFVYKTFNKAIAADVTAVANHNSGTTALSATYEGVTLYAVDTISSSKQFESMPITSEHLEIMENRLLLANNVNGYDTPTALPTNLNITQTTINTVMPASTPVKVYMITTKNLDLAEDKYPIYAGLFIFYDGEVWALPKEYSVLRFNGEFTLKASDIDGATYPYFPPQTVSKKSLVKCTQYFDGTYAGTFPDPFPYLESLSNSTNNGFFLEDPVGTVPFTFYGHWIFPPFVWELHELGDKPSGNWATATGSGGYNGISRFNDMSIYVMDDPDETAGVKGQAFLPVSNYNLGIRYYDYALRSSGDAKISNVKIPEYNPFQRQLTEAVRVEISGVNAAPSWAKYFAITLSKNSASQNFINFTPNIIKVARKTSDGIKYVRSDWFNNIKSDELYGVAIPLDALEGYKQGYSYSQGDYVRIDSATGTPIGYSSSTPYVAAVIDVIDGHVIISAPNIDDLLFTIAGAFSSQYDKISSPKYNPILLAPISGQDNLMTAEFRQRLCYVTIYQQPQSGINNYEVAALGYCNVISGTNQLDRFYSGTGNSLFYNIFGDCHTQQRISNTATFTGLSNTRNEVTINSLWLGMYGRVSPVDNVGQTRSINELRWSNTGDPSQNSNLNGMNKFDFSDYELTNYTSGAINMILGELGDLGRSETLLIICASGGYSTLINQSLIRNTDGSGQLVASSKFIDNIIEINGNPATSSPRSFAISPSGVYWADVLNKQVVMFNQGAAQVVSDIKVKNLFYRLFKDSEANGNQANIYGCFHAMGNQYILGYKSQSEVTKAVLPSTTLENPLSFYYQKSYSWIYNVEKKKWTSIIPKMLEPIALSEKIWAWDNQAQTFDEILSPATGVLPDYNGMVVIPFSDNYDYVKSALAIKLDASRAPDEVWVQSNVNTLFNQGDTAGSTQVATVSDWQYREGDWYCSILRNRLSNITTLTPTEFQARNINGTRLKGKTINVILIWYRTNGHFAANSCSLAYE
jgi:hypothetical protein